MISTAVRPKMSCHTGAHPDLRFAHLDQTRQEDQEDQERQRAITGRSGRSKGDSIFIHVEWPTMTPRTLIAISLPLISIAAHAQQDATQIGSRLLQTAAVKAAVDAIRAAETQTLED